MHGPLLLRRIHVRAGVGRQLSGIDLPGGLSVYSWHHTYRLSTANRALGQHGSTTRGPQRFPGFVEAHGAWRKSTVEAGPDTCRRSACTPGMNNAIMKSHSNIEP